MARRPEPQEPIRKSFLIFGGVVVGVALLAFVLTTFVFGGGGGGGSDEPIVTSPTPGTAPDPAAAAAAPTPTPSPTPFKLTPGGRDPFVPQAGAAPAPTPEVQPAAFTSQEGAEPVTVSVLAVKNGTAEIKLNDTILSGVRPDQVLTNRFNTDEFKDKCVVMKDNGDRFKVCEGKSVKR